MAAIVGLVVATRVVGEICSRGWSAREEREKIRNCGLAVCDWGLELGTSDEGGFGAGSSLVIDYSASV